MENWSQAQEIVEKRIANRIIYELAGKQSSEYIKKNVLRKWQGNLSQFLHINRVKGLFKLGRCLNKQKIYLDFTAAFGVEILKSKLEK